MKFFGFIALGLLVIKLFVDMEREDPVFYPGIKPKEVDSDIISRVLRYRDLIRASSSVNSVPEYIMYGLIAQESAGIPDARGSSGEKGLCQLTRIACKDLNQEIIWLDDNQIFDPGINISLGAEYLRLMYDRSRNIFDVNRWQNALRAYNAGLSRAKGSDISKQYALDVIGKGKYIQEIVSNVS